MRAIFLSLILAGALAGCASPMVEERLGPLPPVRDWQEVFCRTGHLAIQFKSNDKLGLWVNGKTTTGWARIHRVWYDRVGDVMMAKVQSGNVDRLLIDGIPIPGDYDEIGDAVVSPDRQHVALVKYVVDTSSGERRPTVVLDGVEQPGRTAAHLPELCFSPDGKYFIWERVSETDPEKRCLVINGQPGRHYDFVNSVRFLPGGGMAYQAGRDGDVLWVINGLESKPYGETGDMVVSADGKTIAYMAGPSIEDVFVVVNGREGAFHLRDFGPFPPHLLPDGRPVYVAGRRDLERPGYYLVVGEQPGKLQWEYITNVTVSSDGHVAYAGGMYRQLNESSNQVATAEYCVLNGEVVSDAYDSVHDLRFVDGTLFAVGLRFGVGRCLLWNGRPVRQC